MPGYADLHLHTFHSDGIRSPEEVVRLAAHHGLSVIAISDHDNVAAFAEAEPHARAAGIKLIPGVELSITFSGVDVHLLAYAFDPEHRALVEKLRLCRDTRERRGEIMVERLRDHGIPVEMERVRELCGGGASGRPHVARALVEIGAVATVEEAFQRYLSPGGLAWVEKERITLEEAERLVRDAGGITSIAHPTLYPDGQAIVRAIVAEGVGGIEIHHPDVDGESRERLRAIAAENGLLTTGGSDDHGFENRETIGTVRVPLEEIAPVVERWRAQSR